MRVVAFGAHPDDIEIGMGGTIARHARMGDRLVMVVAAIPSHREMRRLEAEATAEARYLEDLRASAKTLEADRKKLPGGKKKRPKKRGPQ